MLGKGNETAAREALTAKLTNNQPVAYSSEPKKEKKSKDERKQDMQEREVMNRKRKEIQNRIAKFETDIIPKSVAGNLDATRNAAVDTTAAGARPRSMVFAVCAVITAQRQIRRTWVCAEETPAR